MRKLWRIQKRENLNAVYYGRREKDDGSAYHEYAVFREGDPADEDAPALLRVTFQTGSRGNPASVDGVLDSDLLEMVRDRLKNFQDGPYKCAENANALRHVEEALLWLAKRADDHKEGR